MALACIGYHCKTQTMHISGHQPYLWALSWLLCERTVMLWLDADWWSQSSRPAKHLEIMASQSLTIIIYEAITRYHKISQETATTMSNWLFHEAYVIRFSWQTWQTWQIPQKRGRFPNSQIGRKCLDWDDDRKHRPGSSKATAEEWQSKTFGDSEESQTRLLRFKKQNAFHGESAQLKV